MTVKLSEGCVNSGVLLITPFLRSNVNILVYLLILSIAFTNRDVVKEADKLVLLLISIKFSNALLPVK